MADIELIIGADNDGVPADKLSQAYPKINRNFTELNDELAQEEADRDAADQAHANSGTAHPAENITYDGAVVGADSVAEAIDSVKATLDAAIISGDSGPEAAAARVSALGETYPTLKERLDSEAIAVTAQLADTANAKFLPAPLVSAKGDGIADDTAALQAAIDYAFSKGDGFFPAVYLPPGRYKITQPLRYFQTGNYCRFVGAGYRSTRIIAGASMSAMLIMGQSGNSFDGRNIVENITFDGNYLADCGIDGTQIAYSTFQMCEFIQMAANGWAIKMGKWVNRILNCQIDGYDSGRINAISNGIYVPNQIINNLIIIGNALTSCVIGLKIEATPHSLIVRDNTFDNCPGTDIWCLIGGHQILIDGNYFEKSGQTGVVVSKSASVTETVKAMIVCHSRYDVDFTEAYQFKDLVITNNQFANNGNAPYIIALSHLAGADIRDNQCLEQYTADNFVNLFWRGAYRGFSKKVTIDHKGGTSQFTKGIVGLNVATDFPYQLQSGVVVKSVYKPSRFNFAYVNNIFGSPINWARVNTPSTSFAVTKDGLSDGLPVWKFDGNDALFKEIIFDTYANNHLKGQYFRLNYLVRGTTGAANGLWFRFSIDEGSGYVIRYEETPTSTDWVSGSDVLIYIPTTALKIKITVELVNKSVSGWMKYFYFVNAAVEPGCEPYERENLKSATAPTTGSWIAGDIVEHPSPAAGGYMGQVCVSTGTPGTWKGYGQIQT